MAEWEPGPPPSEQRPRGRNGAQPGWEELVSEAGRVRTDGLGTGLRRPGAWSQVRTSWLCGSRTLGLVQSGSFSSENNYATHTCLTHVILRLP